MLTYAALCQVDEDKVVNMREKTMSGLIIGSSAFFTKPGETIAPMLGWFLIHQAHGASGAGIGSSNPLPSATAATVSGTQFTCSTGTKVQILT
jgi:hypothetical protein